jgi:hypothetical protein
MHTVAAESDACELPSGVTGACRAGVCAAAIDEQSTSRRCHTVHTRFGDFEECAESHAQYRLSDEARTAAAQAIEARIREGVLYETRVSLVPLGDGGYNIIVFNLHDQGDVRGLVDPSFVAFEVGNYTAGSHWQSRVLQIWLSPYDEGWQISTQSGRRALSRGRAASGLGFLGVVNIRAFRTWLQQSFEHMSASPPSADGVERAVTVESAPSAPVEQSTPEPR